MARPKPRPPVNSVAKVLCSEWQGEWDEDVIPDEKANAIFETFISEFGKAMARSRQLNFAVIALSQITWVQLAIKMKEQNGDIIAKPQAVRYQEYIKSKKWLDFRAGIFKERGFKCELCESKKNLQLHHLSYENFENERPEDVMILCHMHHEEAHGRSFGRNRNLANEGWGKV